MVLEDAMRKYGLLVVSALAVAAGSISGQEAGAAKAGWILGAGSILNGESLPIIGNGFRQFGE
jgi:hypothetical protein